MCIRDAEMSVVSPGVGDLCERLRWNETENTDRSAVIQKKTTTKKQQLDNVKMLLKADKAIREEERKSSTNEATLHQKNTSAHTGELSPKPASVTIITGNARFRKCHFTVSLE